MPKAPASKDVKKDSSAPEKSEKKTEVKKVSSETKTVKAAAKTKSAKAPKTKKVAPTEGEAKTPSQACQVSGCKREYRAKGYCKTHYRKWRNGAFGNERYTTCKDNECRRPQGLNRFGYCEEHFQNYYVKGEKAAKVEAPAKEVAAAKTSTPPAAAAG